MTPFLKELAETFYSAHGIGLKDFCFVTPNKRSGTFLKNHFEQTFINSDAHDEVFVMPEIVTITDFVAGLSEMVVNTRIDSLFSLFKIYSAHKDADIDFDRFRMWGEIALNDFNDVDMFCVNASKLFRNLVALNEIATDYLTDEQREVVESYFPSGMLRKDSGSFWRHFNNKSDSGRKYLRLWEIMAELYQALKDDLAKRGLCLSGGAYRKALEQIEKRGTAVLPYKQVVFVGFNALTTVEFRIFKAIKKLRVELDGTEQSLGDYYWDAAGEILSGDNYAAHFMKKNREHFPSKHKLTKSSNVTGFPAMTKVIACPGNTIQTKVVSELLKEIHKQNAELLKSAEGLAVAMPDENLFFPMLYSLPSELGEVNITMGYPLKITSTFSWMRLLRTLHAHSRLEYGSPCFLRQDMMPFLAHPITRVLLGSKVCQWLGQSVREHRSFTVNAADFINFMNCDRLENPKERKKKLKELNEDKHQYADEALTKILSPISSIKRTGELCDHLLSIIDLIIKSISVEKDSDEPSLLKSQIELDNLLTYADAVNRFKDAAELHKVEMSHISVFALINQLLSTERITLNGEPLSGVQIMGMLETRSLDFENVIITSMNERVFPRRLRNRSFIPNSLRQDCGMATTRFQESIFAYYFYRMISRARNVYLLYDSRSGGLRSGDPSRYIYQLRYLYPDKANLTDQTRCISVVSGSSQDLAGIKTPEVMKILEKYLDKNKEYSLSASAIKKYLKCPLQFYFHYIKRIKVKEEETEAMTPAQIGTIFHDTMHDLYATEVNKQGSPATITADIIDGWLDSKDGGISFAAQTLKNNIIQKYLHVTEFEGDLEGFAKIYFDPIFFYVKSTLEADKLLAPFEYIGGEETEIVSFPLNDKDNREVNLKFIIDRIDRVNGRIRLIDYKTGGDDVAFSSMKDVFGKKHAILQLLLYASLYDIKTGNTEPVKIGIAKPALLKKTGYSYDVTYNNEVFEDHHLLKSEFEEKMRELFAEIFNPDVPFTQCKNKGGKFSPCEYCDYTGICKMKNFGNMLNNTPTNDK